jgi:hypothetical protein
MTKIKLLFTCPHGGTTDPRTTDPPTHLIERVEDHLDTNICKADEGQGFSDENDKLTEDLTQNICDNITKLTRKEPYKEIAKFHRKFIDYNRKQECAYEPKQNDDKWYEQSSIEAEQKYLEYHNSIKQKIEEMLPDGDTSLAFLFDIHGTGREKSPQGRFIEAIIGTDEGRSIEALTERDPMAFKGFKDLLDGKNIRIYPENPNQKQQGFSLDGGYTIQEYGSKRQPRRGLVAIQIEVIHCIRDNRYCREKFGADMAQCIFNFVKPFINQF